MKRKLKLPTNDHKPTFADALTRGMAEVGYMDEDLGQDTMFAPDTIYRYRTGRMVPPQRTRKILLDAINKKREKQNRKN